jgi:hypothetical protein
VAKMTLWEKFLVINSYLKKSYDKRVADCGHNLAGAGEVTASGIFPEIGKFLE